MRRRHELLILALTVVAACERPLPLPPEPDAYTVPVIEDLQPKAAFSEDKFTIVGRGFDPKAENNVVRFPGGIIATPVAADERHLEVLVPRAVRDTGPVIVNNRVAASDPSPIPFTPLGYGHPIHGNSVTDLRFRHRPVGLVNLLEVVLIGSTLFDAVLDDAGLFTWVDGRPTALVRTAEGHGALLATRTDSGGRMFLLDAATSETQASSAEGASTESFVFGLPPATGAVALSIGGDAAGRISVARWTRTATTLAATRVPLAVEDVIGAARLEGDDGLYVMATLREEGKAQRVFSVADARGALRTIWRASEDMVPAGPVEFVQLPEPHAVIALEDGDLWVQPVGGGEGRRIVMTSFLPVSALARAKGPERVLATKAGDGALFEVDVSRSRVSWSVQLRGAPTVLDVARDIDEIAIGNDDDNAVDVVSLEDGRWLGRSSLALGLGSADGGPGGAVSPFSYHPDSPDRPARIQLLARTAPAVIDLEQNALSTLAVHPLDRTASPPIRLAVTSDFHTVVVHRHELGMVDEGDERIVVRDLVEEPTALAFLRDGRLLLASETRVEVLRRTADGFSREGLLALPAGASVVGVVSHVAQIPGRADRADGGRDSVLIAWRVGGSFGCALVAPEKVAVATPLEPGCAIEAAALEPTGVIDLEDGPAILFARSSLRVPAIFTSPVLRGQKPPFPGIVDRPLVLGSSADGRFLVWVNQGAGEHFVRLLAYVPAEADGGPYLSHWAGYRLGASAAGPGTDPGGEWLYVPVPKEDMLTVVQ